MIKVRNFAALDQNNKVIGVIVGNSLEEIQEMFPDATWVETFVDVENKKLAGVGDTYDEEKDDFIPPEYYTDWDELEACGCEKSWEHLKIKE